MHTEMKHASPTSREWGEPAGYRHRPPPPRASSPPRRPSARSPSSCRNASAASGCPAPLRCTLSGPAPTRTWWAPTVAGGRAPSWTACLVGGCPLSTEAVADWCVRKSVRPRPDLRQSADSGAIQGARPRPHEKFTRGGWASRMHATHTGFLSWCLRMVSHVSQHTSQARPRARRCDVPRLPPCTFTTPLLRLSFFVAPVQSSWFFAAVGAPWSLARLCSCYRAQQRVPRSATLLPGGALGAEPLEMPTSCRYRQCSVAHAQELRTGT